VDLDVGKGHLISSSVLMDLGICQPSWFRFRDWRSILKIGMDQSEELHLQVVLTNLCRYGNPILGCRGFACIYCGCACVLTWRSYVKSRSGMWAARHWYTHLTIPCCWVRYCWSYMFHTGNIVIEASRTSTGCIRKCWVWTCASAMLLGKF